MYKVVSIPLDNLEKELNIIHSKGYRIVGAYPEPISLLDPLAPTKFVVIYCKDSNFSGF